MIRSGIPEAVESYSADKPEPLATKHVVTWIYRLERSALLFAAILL